MKNTINRRKFIANSIAAGLSACLATGTITNLVPAKENTWKYPENSAVPAERCPYFDQPLLCCGEMYCEK